MIREEYEFNDLREYLYEHNDILITGNSGEEERSVFFYNLWISKHKNVVKLIRVNDKVAVESIIEGTYKRIEDLDLFIGLREILRILNIEGRNVLIDISSLDHVLIMIITKILLNDVVPKNLFAAYIRPKRYSNQSGNVGFSLCEKILGVKAVPGFARREWEKPVLCSFMGFEGIRLKGIIESISNFDKIIPILAFPVGASQWYNVTMRNSMNVLHGEFSDATIYKCCSESIFNAVDLLKEILGREEKMIIAPLGTRAHSMASAIFASHHSNSKIIYDYVVENKHRAEGIAHVTVYHLTSFIKT